MDTAIFVSYAREDQTPAISLVSFLRAAGFQVWFDKDSLHAGQDWKTVIEQAISRARLLVICLSKRSVDKTGFVQKEMRLALQQAEMRPESQVYIMPVCLDGCPVPHAFDRWHVLDLRESDASDKLLEAIWKATGEKGEAPLTHHDALAAAITKYNRPSVDPPTRPAFSPQLSTGERLESSKIPEYTASTESANPTRTKADKPPRSKHWRRWFTICLLALVGALAFTIFNTSKDRQEARKSFPPPTPMFTSTQGQNPTPPEEFRPARDLTSDIRPSQPNDVENSLTLIVPSFRYPVKDGEDPEEAYINALLKKAGYKVDGLTWNNDRAIYEGETIGLVAQKDPKLTSGPLAALINSHQASAVNDQAELRRGDIVVVWYPFSLFRNRDPTPKEPAFVREVGIVSKITPAGTVSVWHINLNTPFIPENKPWSEQNSVRKSEGTYCTSELTDWDLRKATLVWIARPKW
jgi:hypothetical protein